MSARHLYRQTSAALCLLLGCAGASVAAPAGDELEQLLAQRGLLASSAINEPSLTQRMSDLVVHAMGFIGVPYKFGGNSAQTGGLDCSGFVKAVYEQMFGLRLPRSAAQQAQATEQIDASMLEPGDLVFFNTLKRSFSHVGIYIGGGRFVHAPRPGSNIQLADMRERYWSQRFEGARRVQASAQPAVVALGTPGAATLALPPEPSSATP